nr:unnamed protein product [Spirometra erinaceieuropaei]
MRIRLQPPKRPQGKRPPAVQSTARAVLGRARRQHQDWFNDKDATINNLLAEKNRPHKAYVDHPINDNRAAYCRSRRLVQQRLREMQDTWTAHMVEEIQGTWIAPTVVSLSTSLSSLAPSANSDRPLQPPPPSSSSSSCSSSSSTASTSPAVAYSMPINTIHDSDTPTNTNITTPTTVNTNDENLVYTRPHCDHTTSHIGLVGRLQIHRTDTGKPVPGTPTYILRIRHHCPHCPRTFMRCIGLFGYMPVRESGIDRGPDTPSALTMPSPAHAPQTSAPTAATTTITTEADTDTADFSCPHCPRTFTSRIGLVGHLRIHRIETGKPKPVASTYARRIRLHCPHCTCKFIHRMGILGHMRVNGNLR